jgi:hypothetical protein
MVVGPKLRNDFWTEFTTEELHEIENGIHTSIKPKSGLDNLYWSREENGNDLRIKYYIIKDTGCLMQSVFNSILLVLDDFKFRNVLYEVDIAKVPGTPSGMMNKLYSFLLEDQPIVSSSTLSSQAYKVWLDLIAANHGLIIKIDEGLDLKHTMMATMLTYVNGSKDILKYLDYGHGGNSDATYTRFLVSKDKILHLGHAPLRRTK